MADTTPDICVQEIDAASKNGRLIIRLSAPTRRNALTARSVAFLYDTLTNNRDALLLLGSSTPGMFCAGADLSESKAAKRALSDRLYECYEALITRPGASIAVVEGPAVGGGAQLAAACDLRVASRDARWRWVGPAHGLTVGAWILPSLFGRARGIDLAISGRWIDAVEAGACGFATVDDDPWALAVRMADGIARADPAQITRIKQIFTRRDLLDGLADERAWNRANWSGAAPSPRAAAQDGLQPR